MERNVEVEMAEKTFAVRRSSSVSKQVVVGILVFLIAFSVPWWADASATHLLVEVFVLITVAQMWNMLSSFGGVVSIGQQAFVGVGAYGFFYVANFATGNPFVLLPVAGLVAAAIAFVFSPMLFRLRGAHFSIATWALAEMFRIGVNNSDTLGAGTGLSFDRITYVGRAMRGMVTYWSALAVLAVAILTLILLLRSPYGVALRAIKTNEGAAESVGIRVLTLKRAIFVLSAAITGLAGGVAYLNTLQVSPDAAFSVNWVAFAIFAVIIGGAGSIEGPIVGALVFFGLRETLSNYGAWYLIILGLAAIIVTLFIPEGLFGWAKKKWGWGLFDMNYHVHLKDGDV
jgi:branched-chain amino acid transport system permease protein